MSRILITGASGFVGRQVLRALGSSEMDLHAAAHEWRHEPDRCATWHYRDLRDPKQAYDLVNSLSPQMLVHLAWCTEPGSFYSDPANSDWLQSSLAMIKAFAANGGKRLLIAGSCAEYGWHTGECIEGVTPLLPTTVYGKCKKALFEAATAATGFGRLSLVWPRLFFLYGPSEHRTRFIPSIITDLLAGRVAVCRQGGLRRDYVMVADAGEALAGLLHSDFEGPVNVGTGQAPSLGDIATELSGLVDSEAKLTILNGAPANAAEQVVLADTCRLSRILPNWSPTALSVGLSKTVAWWRNETNH
jgi:nucleoside-diphosphate-sugar epimerase